jgi:hypothetical protein
MLTEKKPWDLIFFFPINWRQFLQGKRKLKKKGSKIIYLSTTVFILFLARAALSERIPASMDNPSLALTTRQFIRVVRGSKNQFKTSPL